MEILYLYFLESPELKFGNQDINFGGKYRFEYNLELKKLTVTENPYYIENFFSLNSIDTEIANVLNVTSIIGENGAGKTSLLKTLKINLIEGNNSGILNPLILVLKTPSGVIVKHSENIIIETNNLKDYSIKIEDEYTQKISEFSYIDFISFSNVFDGDSDVALLGGYDISTNYLIRNDFKYNVEMRQINPDVNQRQIDTHLFEDIERQISFINRYKKEEFLPFELPEYIYISSKKDLSYDFGFDQFDKQILNEYGFLNCIIFLSNLFNDKSKKRTEKERLLAYFSLSCFFNFLMEIATYYRQIIEKSKFVIPKELYEINANLEVIALSIIDDFIKQSNEFAFTMDAAHHSWLLGVKEFIMTLKEIIEKDDRSMVGDLNRLEIKITDTEKENFKKFFERYKKSYRIKTYLYFSWRNLSSGEKALLNIYSRFYSLSNRSNLDELRQNIIILIDEGDLYLHPAWQKKFVYLMLDFLPKVYSKTKNGDRRNIQIILTTNSPIPASDLPNGNTIFLEKNGNKTIIKDSLNDQKETFAANIYTLFSDSFFIKDGLIGDFAMTKINEIITQLTRGAKPDKKQREVIRNTIHQIGEPILKHKLTQLYNDRFNLEIHERLDKIEKQLGI